MGLIRFIQDHNRNKELKQMRQLKEQELTGGGNKPDRRCPACGRIIPFDARTCPYCSKKFEDY